MNWKLSFRNDPARSTILAAAILSFFVTLGFFGLMRPLSTQWDFFVFFDAAHSLLNGRNPYAMEMGAFNPGGSNLGYTYPPLSIFYFIPFYFLPASLAASAWMLLKLFAAFTLVRLVLRDFLMKLQVSGRHIVFLLLGFNCTLLWDLIAGNIIVFQSLLLFLGFREFLNDKFLRFVGFIVFAATLKLTPIIFLGLLLLPGIFRWREFFFGVAIFTLYCAANFLFLPELTENFRQAVTYRFQLESGILAPSLLACANDFLQLFRSISTLGLTIDWLKPVHVYAGAMLFVVGITSKKIWSNREYLNNREGRVFLILLATVVFTIVLPRAKSYDFLFLIPATIFALEKISQKYSFTLYTLFSLPFVFPMSEMGKDITSSPLAGPIKKLVLLAYQYAPLVAIFIVWLILLRVSNPKNESQIRHSPQMH